MNIKEQLTQVNYYRGNGNGGTKQNKYIVEAEELHGANIYLDIALQENWG